MPQQFIPKNVETGCVASPLKRKGWRKLTIPKKVTKTCRSARTPLFHWLILFVPTNNIWRIHKCVAIHKSHKSQLRGENSTEITCSMGQNMGIYIRLTKPKRSFRSNLNCRIRRIRIFGMVWDAFLFDLFRGCSITHIIHVWYICLHLP